MENILKKLIFVFVIILIFDLSAKVISNHPYVEDHTDEESFSEESEAPSENYYITPFESRYDLTDSSLDVNSLDFDGVIEISSVDAWQDYMQKCVYRGYRIVFFNAPSDMTFDIDDFMSKNDILSTVIYTMPSDFGDRTLTGYNFTYTYSHDILKAIKNGAEDKLSAKQQTALSAARAFLNGLDPNLSDYEKELAIHNYVCETLTYTRDDSLPDIVNCYGGLILGRGNCQAYTDCFNLLCGLAGFDTGRITCVADGEDHSLNYISINGNYYFVDCTFDDGIEDKERGYGMFYFNAPYSFISINHKFDNLTITPVQEPDSNCYYIHYNMYANTPLSLEDTYRRLYETSWNGEILFNTANGSASLTDIFMYSHPEGATKISVSKSAIGQYEVLKFSLT